MRDRTTRALSYTAVLLAALLSRQTVLAQTCPLSTDRTSKERLETYSSRFFVFTTAGATREVQNVTAYCLSCHDATVARLMTARTTQVRTVGSIGGALDGDHPVDIVYPLFRPGLYSPSEIDPRLVLTDGRVTCKTCHGGSDPAKSYLSMPLEGSALCLACHRK